MSPLQDNAGTCLRCKHLRGDLPGVGVQPGDVTLGFQVDKSRARTLTGGLGLCRALLSDVGVIVVPRLGGEVHDHAVRVFLLAEAMTGRECLFDSSDAVTKRLLLGCERHQRLRFLFLRVRVKLGIRSNGAAEGYSMYISAPP